MEEKRAQYAALAAQIRALLDGEDDWICAMANVSAAIFDMLPELNWAGFYRVKDGNLILGPFQGKVACIHIPMGKGVCGTAAERDETQVVPDVHAFPGHIACDSASNAEIVLPIHRDGGVVAVLDIDSPVIGRFTEADRAGLEGFVRVLEEQISF